jgi:plastocyanin
MSMRKASVLLTLGALPFVTACGGGETPQQTAPPATAAPAAQAGSGSLSGKVAYDGSVPASEKVKLSADPKCAAMHKDGLEKQSIEVKEGGLAHVLVYVKSGISGSHSAPAEAALLDQNGCNYSPHVLAVQAGQPIKIRNSDDTLHNIHPRPSVNTEFNIGQPRQGMESTKTFDKPELKIPVGCDVHPWMRSYIHVLSHPFFAVSSEDGSFEIKGLPAGDYEIEAVHEKLPPVTAKVSVKDGEAATLDLTLKG